MRGGKLADAVKVQPAHAGLYAVEWGKKKVCLSEKDVERRGNNPVGWS